MRLAKIAMRMPPIKATSKYAYDPELFKPEPPENPKLVKALFCGRVAELRRGIETLKRFGDVNGRRAKQRDKRPWVIHGESRSGKSHMARRILADLPSGRKKLKLLIPARDRLDATEVMRNLFERMRLHFEGRLAPLQNEPAAASWADAVELIAKAASLPPGGDSITFTVRSEFKSTWQDRFGISGAVLRFETSMGEDETAGESTTVTLRQPHARDFAQYCAIMVDALVRANQVDHVLILVDDVDLLEAYLNERRNGDIQRSILTDALAMLHETPCVDVVLTARSWYAYAKKEFQPLVDLSQSELSAEDLVKIHDLRFSAVAPSGQAGFLDGTALRQAATDVRGLPGVFLQHLDTAFRAFQDEDSWLHRDYEWYLNVFRRHFERFRGKCPDAANRLVQAAREGVFEIDVRDSNPFHQTVFDNEFVFQSYYRETTYYTDALLHKVLQAHNEANRADADRNQ